MFRLYLKLSLLTFFKFLTLQFSYLQVRSFDLLIVEMAQFFPLPYLWSLQSVMYSSFHQRVDFISPLWIWTDLWLILANETRQKRSYARSDTRLQEIMLLLLLLDSSENLSGQAHWRRRNHITQKHWISHVRPG